MKVIVDDKIPFIKGEIEKIADEVIYLSGRAFTPDIVKDADALVVRTRTQCNRQLLEGSSIRFIATATIGFDHIDTDYCRKANICWENAVGCNSSSVEQYIHSALLLLSKEKGITPNQWTMGVIGVGHVGSKVVQLGKRLGMKVLLNDPPRAAQEGTTGFSSLEELAEQCDLLTFHTPLNRNGAFNTFHLADQLFFARLQRQPVLINTSRGEVVETEALLKALCQGDVSEAIIDVWEHEPGINQNLLKHCFLGTPHIAGYSADGKANATRMALEALCRFFQRTADFHIEPPKPERTTIQATNPDEALLQIYNPQRDSDALKAHPELFEELRGNYPLRREPQAYTFRSE